MSYERWIADYVRAQRSFVRGRCADATALMVKAFPELRRACGFVVVLHPNGIHEEQHWWCVAPDGTIVDPTVSQFIRALSYEEIDPANPHRPIPTGKCMECGEPAFNGNTFCSSSCEHAYVGGM